MFNILLNLINSKKVSSRRDNSYESRLFYMMSQVTWHLAV